MPFITITVTVPKQVVNVDRVRQEIIDTQNRLTKQKLTQLFNQTTEGWRTRPSFASQREDTAGQLGILVYAAGQGADTYALVNEGARPHVIRPRHAKVLRFQRGYRAGTKPRTLRSQAFVRSPPWWNTLQVRHPGFEAREFTKTIADEHEPEFNQDMQDAIARGAHP